MTSYLDSYLSANLLFKEHGELADLYAAERADAMLDAGDLDGLAIWKRILKAINEMKRPAQVGDTIN